MILGTFVRRYKRFFSDILLSNGELVVAHVPNTGSMQTCLQEGWKVALSLSDNPKRKLRYTLEVIFCPQGPVMVNTIKANRLVERLLEKKSLKPFEAYDSFKREVSTGESKLDFQLTSPHLTPYYLEVKSVSFLRGDTYNFPDAITTRGQKHLDTLTALAKEGKKAGILFLICREGGKTFSLAKDIDPEYVRKAKIAKESGVEFFAFQNRYIDNSWQLEKALSVEIDS